MPASARDRRSGPPHRRRPVQVWLRDADRIRQGPQGPVRRHGPLHLGEEERAGMDAGLAARRLPALADHARAEMGQGRIRSDRLPGPLLLLRAEEEGRAEVARRDRSRKFCAPTRSSAFRCASARRCSASRSRRRGRRRRTAKAAAAWPRRGRCGVRFGFGRHHLQGRARQGRRAVHADLGGAAAASRSGEEVSRLGGADQRQFLRHAQFGGVLRRLVRLRAAGRALPDGAVDLFPHQREAIPASSSAR